MIRSALRLAAIAAVLLLPIAGCMGPQGDTVASQRKAAQNMRSDTLAKLYKIRPGSRQAVRQAVGYAVFSNVGVNVFFVSGGTGYGIVRDNRSRKDTYMKMASGGLGLGIGVKDFRGVFVFTKRKAMRQFVTEGWDASAQADAAAKAGKKGGALAGAVDVAPGIKLYQITENGLALQATVQGTKYWKDDDLNR
ncbi:MAG: YSC84-related protein [Alphaproteobacteria bacterium]|nr:YSC84-related protein [Alphaproteobacteria bacterium]